MMFHLHHVDKDDKTLDEYDSTNQQRVVDHLDNLLTYHIQHDDVITVTVEDDA